jgi:hypothetical protein
MIKNATFTSVWDGGIAIITDCKVKTETGEIFDIQISEDMADLVNCLEAEYVTIDDKRYDVHSEEERTDEFCYWYGSGKNCE